VLWLFHRQPHSQRFNGSQELTEAKLISKEVELASSVELVWVCLEVMDDG
jgi:hypothetical protein